MKPVETVGLIINSYKNEIIMLSQQLVQWLLARQVNIIATGAEAEALKLSPMSEEEFCQKAELVMVIGGDGTMLRAARTVYGKEIPILGINQGYLGFLAELEVEEVEENLDRLLLGDFQIQRRMMLSGAVYRNQTCIAKVNALNDLVVTKGALARLIALEIDLEENLVDSFHGDGIIFATSTGSTGYSLSAGGPIVHPMMDVCIVTPICPHSLASRPIIFSPEHHLRVRLTSSNAPAMLTVDGQHGIDLQRGDEIVIHRSVHDTSLVILKERNFFEVMRDKLKSTAKS